MNRYRIEENTICLDRRFDDVFEELFGENATLKVRSDLVENRMKREAFHARTYLRVSLQKAIKQQCSTGHYQPHCKLPTALRDGHGSNPCATLPKLGKSSHMGIKPTISL